MSDALTVTSRAFFERTKAKVMASIVAGAGALFLLALCSQAGGNAAHDHERGTHLSNVDDHYQQSLVARQGGFGMACFLFLLGFFLLASAACYISPYVCGSMKEKRMLRAPEELEAPYATGPSVTNV